MSKFKIALITLLGFLACFCIKIQATDGASLSRRNVFKALNHFNHGIYVKNRFQLKDGDTSFLQGDFTDNALQLNLIQPISDSAGITFQSTNGTNIVFIDASNARMAIGTTTVNRNVSIYEGSSNEAFLQFTNLTTGTVASDGAHIGLDNNEDLQIAQLESSKLIEFFNNGNQAAVIDSSGNFGIGTSPPDVILHVVETDLNITPFGGTTIATERVGTNYINVLGSTESGILLGDAADSDIGFLVYDHTGDHIRVGANASEHLRIQADGTLSIGKTADTTPAVDVNGDVHATAFVTTSDQDLKSNITEVSASLADFKAIHPKRWKWKLEKSDFTKEQLAKIKSLYGEKTIRTVSVDKETGETEVIESRELDFEAVAAHKKAEQVGFVAQDFEGTAYAKCVVTLAGEAKGLDYSCITASLWAANQAMLAEVETLKTKVQALEGN